MRTLIIVCFVTLTSLTGCVTVIDQERQETTIQGPANQELTEMELLGKVLFFDDNLSQPTGQSCATCHDASAGWSGPRSDINSAGAVYPGADDTRFGNRKPPTASYATQSPVLHFDEGEGIFFGGNFWDGRATGWILGEPAAEQAQAPFLNPVEHNLPEPDTVVNKVCNSGYADQFKSVFGEAICTNVVNAYNAIGQAIFAFESSGEVNAFTSKYDYYLRDPEKYPLTEQERFGLELFEDVNRAKCSECHPSALGEDGSLPLFTDFSFDNLGLPVNPLNPTYQMPAEFNPDGADWVDPGLGGFLAQVPRFAHYAQANMGLHKVPTLRNIDKRPTADFVKAFGHNGVFKSLREIVHFYNTRDKLPVCEEITGPKPGGNCWNKPEVNENVNTEELGDLELSEEEEWAIVTFMKTLSDGWKPGVE